MRYHDFQMAGYTVSDFGASISLHLVYDYSGQAKDESIIQFSEVAAYHFAHTGAAIITTLSELPVAELLIRVALDMTKRWRAHGGYVLWDDDPAQYRENLEGAGYRAWAIDSAVGFEGFVIARAVAQVEPNKTEHRIPDPPPMQSVMTDTTSTSSIIPAPGPGAGVL